MSTMSIQYADAVRFKKPSQPTFARGGSILSILSLVFMTVLSTIMLLNLTDPANDSSGFLGSILPFLRAPNANSSLASWTWVPFAFTIFGAGVGALFELGLLLSGHPFEQTRTRFGTFILHIRLLNLGPVVATIFFAVSCMLIASADMRFALLYLAGAACFGLGFALFFNGPPAFVSGALVGTQLVQIVLAFCGTLPPGGTAVRWYLVGQAVLQIGALVVGTATPIKSTAFHVMSTVGGIFLYLAITTITNSSPNFSHEVAVALPSGSLQIWGFILACIAGLIAVARTFPTTFSNWREAATNGIWSVIYFLVVSNTRFPNPHNLSKVYGGNNKPKRTDLKPYYQNHPQFLPQNLSIPSAATLERNVLVFADLIKKTKKIFSLIATLDHILPQSDASAPLADKERMQVWSDGSEYWPSIFQREIFGLTIPDGGKLEATPKPAIEAFKAGQLLAYLTEFGVATTFAKPAPERGPGALVSDFRFLEVYETKPDYHSYGGMAYFQVNSETQRLDLVSVVAPHSTDEIPADPRNPTFRRAESLVLASIYFQVISGKHLAEIHMTYNLVEVAMHNSFDVQGQWAHPFRTFLYIHFFSHELAEELTTEHLVQEKAVFSQIFATTHNSLISHLNDCYTRFEYGVDEDFEARAAMMTMPPNGSGGGNILPNACIRWELEYAEIWQRYTTSLIDIIYENDAAVQSDKYLQDFHKALLEVIVNGLPERYGNFQTKVGVARFASDTIHHTVVRHQVYGTTGIPAALDPRISKTQVPRDAGTYAVDAWRSLATVALATGKARFTLLLNDFTDLLEGVDGRYQQPMHDVFNQLQEDLRVLEAKWNATEDEKRYNVDYFRAVPSSLHTGPGY